MQKNINSKYKEYIIYSPSSNRGTEEHELVADSFEGAINMYVGRYNTERNRVEHHLEFEVVDIQWLTPTSCQFKIHVFSHETGKKILFNNRLRPLECHEKTY